MVTYDILRYVSQSNKLLFQISKNHHYLSGNIILRATMVVEELGGRQDHCPHDGPRHRGRVGGREEAEEEAPSGDHNKKPFALSPLLRKNKLRVFVTGRYDTQHDDIQPNDIQHNDTLHNGTLYYDAECLC
jgi:hypothetical protein